MTADIVGSHEAVSSRVGSPQMDGTARGRKLIAYNVT